MATNVLILVLAVCIFFAARHVYRNIVTGRTDCCGCSGCGGSKDCGCGNGSECISRNA